MLTACTFWLHVVYPRPRKLDMYCTDFTSVSKMPATIAKIQLFYNSTQCIASIRERERESTFS